MTFGVRVWVVIFKRLGWAGLRHGWIQVNLDHDRILHLLPGQAMRDTGVDVQYGVQPRLGR
jgi:hypothetical protein